MFQANWYKVPHAPMDRSGSGRLGLFIGSVWCLVQLLLSSVSVVAATGDLDNNGTVSVEDSIVALQIVAGVSSGELPSDADINGDGAVGLEEAVDILSTIGKRSLLFPIRWPFPTNTEIRGIVHFDHDQQQAFNPYKNDANGKGMTYFCVADTAMPRFEHMHGAHGEILVGITDGHRGNDYFVPAGTLILAVADGKVILETSGTVERDRVKIVHDNGWITFYAHSIVRENSLHNQSVVAGTKIGTVAATGTGGTVRIGSQDYYELHFEILRPNPKNVPQYSSVDPYLGDCSHPDANPEPRALFIDSAPLAFIPSYFSMD